jgi:hypothetical protein
MTTPASLFRALATATCALLAGCPTAVAPVDTPACVGDPVLPGAAWEVVHDEATAPLKGALFSTWGAAADDVWTVGATATDKPEFGPQVLHWDGKGWRRFKSGATGELWWVTGGGPGSGNVWMAGSNGQIVKRSADASFTVMQAPDTTQLFGIFAAADNDVYAVGGPGSCSGTGPCGVIWHYDGTTWSAASGVSSAQNSAASWFKVWGNGKDVWIVGSGGHILHRSGGVWSDETSGVTDPIFTVAGSGTLAIAVGGFGAGVLLENSGSGWSPGKIQGALPALNGVSVSANGNAVAVGTNGTIWRRCGGTWSVDLSGSGTTLDDLHSVWRSENGDVFAVGGQIVVPPFAQGTLVHFGPALADKAISP